MATVINIRNAPAEWQLNPDYVYIGRANKRYGVQESIWHNPFSMRDGLSREQVISRYAYYLMLNDDLKSQLPSLKGKILVCWCKPKACHGDILIHHLSQLDAPRTQKHVHAHYDIKRSQFTDDKAIVTTYNMDGMGKVGLIFSAMYTAQDVRNLLASFPQTEPYPIKVYGGRAWWDSFLQPEPAYYWVGNTESEAA